MPPGGMALKLTPLRTQKANRSKASLYLHVCPVDIESILPRSAPASYGRFLVLSLSFQRDSAKQSVPFPRSLLLSAPPEKRVRQLSAFRASLAVLHSTWPNLCTSYRPTNRHDLPHEIMHVWNTLNSAMSARWRSG